MRSTAADASRKSPSENQDTIDHDPISAEELNKPADKPSVTKIRITIQPGVFFNVKLNGKHDLFVSVFAFIVSFSFLCLAGILEYILVRGGNLLPAIILMWGLSSASVVFTISNAKRAGLRGWPLSRVIRNALNLMIPNAAVFFIQLGLFPLLDKNELTIAQGRITLHGGNLFRWHIDRNLVDVKDVTFRSAGIQPMFSVVFEDAFWHLGQNMTLDERRWVRTELARFIGK
jgi:hypothetical protein